MEGGGCRDCEETLPPSMRSREIYDLEGSGRHIEKPLVQQEVGMVMEVLSAFMETCCWKSACEFQSIEGVDRSGGAESQDKDLRAGVNSSTTGKGWGSENRSSCEARWGYCCAAAENGG